MSRIGKLAIPIPTGVQVALPAPGEVQVQGPKGSLSRRVAAGIRVEVKGSSVLVARGSDDRQARAHHGSARAHIANMIQGVTKGYEKQLEVVGVGWNAQVQHGRVQLSVGYCQPVEVAIPSGVTAACPSPTSILIFGPDKDAVGQLAARLRSARPPEPYKGKGVRYKGEYVRQKQGKTFGS